MSWVQSSRPGGVAQARFASCFGGRQLVTRKVAAEILGVDIKTLKTMREQHNIPSVRTGSGEIRFREEDLHAYLTKAMPLYNAR